MAVNLREISNEGGYVRRSLWWVIPRVVLGRMAIPAVVERPLVVRFVVVNREVTVLEPHDLNPGRLNATGIEALVVHR